MASSLMATSAAVAKKRLSDDVPGDVPDDLSERYEFRVNPSWFERVMKQAKRHGLGAAAYIRLATTLKLEQDEASDPSS